MKLYQGSFTIGRVLSVDNTEQEAILELKSGARVVVDIFGHRPVRRGQDVPVLPDQQGPEDVPAPRVGGELVLVADKRSLFDRRLLYARLWCHKAEFDQVAAVFAQAA